MTTTFEKAQENFNRRFILDHPSEAIPRLESMEPEETAALLTHHPVSLVAYVLRRVTPDFAKEVFIRLPSDLTQNLLLSADSIVMANLISQMEPQSADSYLSTIPVPVAQEFRRLITYSPDSAGHLMDTRFQVFRETMTVKQCLHRLRRMTTRRSRVLYLVDASNRLVSKMDMQDLVLADYNRLLQELANPIKAVCQAQTSREELVQILEDFKLASLPVVDSEGKVLGVVRHDALIKAVEEKATVDIQTMFGASKDERALSKPGFSIRKRLPWLEINLLTAFLASAVVGLFEGTIAKFTALAVLLPVVAGQSGNAGAQALAVTMRGLALKEISVRQWSSVMTKEVIVGFINGLAIALTTSTGVYFWSHSLGLAAVIGLSMVLSMVSAGIAGATVPIVLTRLGQDPATASSIILTTVTDIAGFFSFLGIATLLSNLL